MAEELSLGVNVDGVAESVKGLNAVAEAEKRLEDATRKAMGALTKENLVAVQKARAEYDSLARTAQSVASTMPPAASAIGAVSSATKVASVSVGQFGSSIGLAGQALNRLNPALGSVVTMAGSAASAIQGLSTAGLGPLGLAVAGVSLAISIGTTVFNAYAGAQEEAKRQSDEFRQSLDAIVRSLDTVMSRQAQQRTNAARDARISRGAGTAAELEGASQVASDRFEELKRQARIRGDEAESREIGLARLQVTGARERAQEARSVADSIEQAGRAQSAALDEMNNFISEQEGAGRIGSSGGGSRSGGGGAPERKTSDVDKGAQAEAEAAEAASALQLARKAFENSELVRSEEARLEIIQKGLDGERDRRTRAAEEEISRRDELNASNLTRVRNAVARENAAREKGQKVTAEIQGAVAGAFGVVNSAMEASLATSKKTEEEKSKIMATGAFIQSVVGAALSVARAAASYPDVAGIIAHGTAAAAYVVSAATAAAKMGGGGGGGAAAPAAASGGGGGASRPSAFDSPASNDNNSAGPSRVIVQVGGLPLGTPADTGRAVDYALHRSRRSYSGRI